MTSKDNCKYYNDYGACPYGTLCKFNHNYENASLYNISKQLDVMITMLNKIEQEISPKKRGRSKWRGSSSRRNTSASRITKALHSRGLVQPHHPSINKDQPSTSGRQNSPNNKIEKSISEISDELKNLEISRKRKGQNGD